MKFAKYLTENSVPEWRSRYVNYRRLKKAIKRVVAARERQKQASHEEIDISGSPHGVTSSASNILERIHAFATSRGQTSDSIAFSDDPSFLQRLEAANLGPQELEFFRELDAELRKADAFFCDKERQGTKRFEDLQCQCLIMASKQKNKKAETRPSPEANVGNMVNNLTRRRSAMAGSDNNDYEPDLGDILPGELATSAENFKPVVKNPRARLQKACLEYYRFLELLKNFRIINQTSVTKILKKNEKVTGIAGDIYMARANEMHLYTSRRVEDLISQTERLYTFVFESGNRQHAMRKLRVPDIKSQPRGWTSWRTGFFVGLSLPAIALTLRDVFVNGVPDENITLLLLIYGGFSIPITFLFYYSALLHIWGRFHVNWVLVFELDPRDYMTAEGFSEFASLLLLLFAYNMYLAVNDNFVSFIPIRWYPLLLLVIIIVVLVNPMNAFYRSSRSWFLQTLGRIFLSGAFQVQFRDFFITDLLCSMTYMFVSLQTLVCSALHDVDSLAERCELSNSWIVPFMTAFPAFWRLLQCLRRYHDHRLMHPHLTNATKYSLQLAVIFISAVARITDSVVARVFWIIFAVAASLFAHFWDVSFDWGLSQKNKVNKYLRKVIIYPRWLYIVAIGLNFLLRLSWVFLLSPNNWGLFHDARLVVYLQAQVEMFRRFIWSIIRMENEHLNNVGKFRAITEVPLPFRVNMLPPEDVELPIRRPSLPLASSPSRSRRGSVP